MSGNRNYLHNEKGFTLVEMMVVLIIISVLIGGGVRFYQGYIGRARITKATSDITTLQTLLEVYYVQNNAYPNPNNASQISVTGLNPTVIATSGSAAASIPYVYNSNPDYTSYSIWTYDKVDGSNFVEGTGSSGTPSPLITTATTY